MNVACPECNTVYRIDPARLPAGGAGTRCRSCGTAFRVDPNATGAAGGRTTGTRLAAGPDDAATGTPATSPTADRATGGAPDAEQPSGGKRSGQTASAPAFGPQDPDTRARRLARALVSDIKVYNPDKWEKSRAEGTLRAEFRDEIMKSWEEYVEQVGEQMAKNTPFFREALNDILAAGEQVF